MRSTQGSLSLRSFALHFSWPGRCNFVVHFPKFVSGKSTKIPGQRSRIPTPNLVIYREFFFFSSCFLLCRVVGYPQFIYVSRSQIWLTMLRLFDTHDLRSHFGSALRAFQSSTQEHWACRIHRKPGNPGYLGLDQNLLGFVLSQSLSCSSYYVPIVLCLLL